MVLTDKRAYGSRLLEPTDRSSAQRLHLRGRCASEESQKQGVSSEIFSLLLNFAQSDPLCNCRELAWMEWIRRLCNFPMIFPRQPCCRSTSAFPSNRQAGWCGWQNLCGQIESFASS